METEVSIYATYISKNNNCIIACGRAEIRYNVADQNADRLFRSPTGEACWLDGIAAGFGGKSWPSWPSWPS